MLLAFAGSNAAAQELRGANALGHAMEGIGVNTRVLLIGAHPDDEDTFLISWLSRGRHITTAYLSLTRGDGGQNIIGNELGEALGVVRTEELLAARRVDGAMQYFTRAFDFGYSRDTTDTYAHWPKDTILGDVVRVVRAFRPHVIVGVFSGTTRDGHGHHQVSGILAREAYDHSGDTVRFPVASFGVPWTSHKFYRAARFNAAFGTVSFNVGEYSPLLGESYGEIAGRSRSQHKSQAFGAGERKGPLTGYLRREHTRVNEATPANEERTFFDGIDTSWARFRGVVPGERARVALDSLPAALEAARRAFDPYNPRAAMRPLFRARALLETICPAQIGCGSRDPRSRADRDLSMSVAVALTRVQAAVRLASGVTIDVNSVEHWPVDQPMPMIATIFNRGTDTLAVSGAMVFPNSGGSGISLTRIMAPGSFLVDTVVASLDSVSQPWWLERGRTAGVFNVPGTARAEASTEVRPGVAYSFDVGGRSLGETFTDGAAATYLYVDDVKGELERPVAAVPLVSVRLDQSLQYAPAGTAIDRELQVTVTGAIPEDSANRVTVRVQTPPGIAPDSAARTVVLPRYNTQRTVSFRLRGRLPAGRHEVRVVAEHDGRTYSRGYTLIDYDHIEPRRIYRDATLTLNTVDVSVPRALNVAYVTGVSDNVAPALAQLGVPVTVLPVAELARANLSRFSTIVIGPRAYDSHPTLVTINQRLLDWARAGGTLVVQYGQYEMQQAGIMPHPVTINRPHDRVTHENAPVTILEANARELRWPHRITATDFDGWVQERALYMPRTFDAAYRPLLAMNDPGENANRGAILVAPMGRGRYVYTTLAFFRQLPAGVPGAARLFVNLLSAGLPEAQR